MSGQPLAYLLVLVDLLVGAVLLSAPVLLVLTVLGRRERARTPRTRRRCEACGQSWKGYRGRNHSKLGLRLRRRARRRAASREESPPAWARPRGWSRCPSCLSTDVRDSRQP